MWSPLGCHDRRHQLRLHLLALGCPIVGDSLYAPPAGYHLTVVDALAASPPAGQDMPAPPSYGACYCSPATQRLGLGLGFA